MKEARQHQSFLPVRGREALAVLSNQQRKLEVKRERKKENDEFDLMKVILL